MGAQVHSEWVDRWISDAADRQHGVVARRQLIAVGVRRRAIGHRIERGRLHSVHRGVYAVGHNILSARGRWMAAVLAAGPDAALSYRSAAALWGIGFSERTEVTVPRAQRGPKSVMVHCSRLRGDEVTVRDGIPVTTVPRTLLDLATVVSTSQLERAVNEAEIRGLADPLSLPVLFARYPGRPGITALRRILGEPAVLIRSELEARFRRFLRKHRLPPPAWNVVVAGMECDCVWHERRLIVELDGRTPHDTALAFERDRARDRALIAAGWRVVRITWRQLRDQPGRVAADMRKLLTG
jgi:very-short-patch-repair endonuclease